METGSKRSPARRWLYCIRNDCKPDGDSTVSAMKQEGTRRNLVKAIAGLVGGGGGGRPNMAQAGGKNPAGIQDALAKAEEALADQIK